MSERITCAGCHRVEHWRDGVDGRTVQVELQGGVRQPAGSAVLARGRTALAAARGSTGPVVGVCGACGQLQVAEAGSGLPPIEVRLDTSDGAVVVQGPVVRGPGGVVSPDDAEAFLVERLETHWSEGLAGDLGRLPFFVVLLPIVAGWMAAALFVLSFLAAVWEGPAPAVQGAPGYYESPTGGR